MPTLKDGSRVEDPRLDRLVAFDEQSRGYAALDVLTAPRPRSWTWRIDRHLDQGREGACVGFAFTHEFIARPAVTWPDGHQDVASLQRYAREQVYWQAQQADQWPGGAYPGATPRYEGTSILAGAQTVQQLGFIDEYRWAFGEDDLWVAVARLGPAVIGVNWYEGMYEPNGHGFIEPTGRVLGGHAIVVYRTRARTARRTTEWYELWNSWGPSWGQAGTAKVSREHMARLLAEDGEACIPIVRRTS